MIQINNLSQYEVEMLDHMWTLDTEEEFFEWYNLLDEAVPNTLETLPPATTETPSTVIEDKALLEDTVS